MAKQCPDLTHLREEIRDIVRQTNESGKEVALQVCELDDDLVPGQVRQGKSRTRVRVPTDCNAGDLKGIIHTHPGGVPKPSEMDNDAAEKHGWDFVCVADEDANNIGCYCFDGE